MAVEISIILARLEASVLFLDKEERSSLGGFGRMNFPGAEVFVDEFVHGLPFFDGEGIKFSYFWNKGLIQVYGRSEERRVGKEC